MERHNTGGSVDIGALLRKRRREAGLTQEGVGLLVGRSKAVISQYEKNQTRITCEMLMQICDALDITLREFFFKDEDYYLFPGESNMEITERLIRKIVGLSDKDKDRLVGYIDALGGD